MPLILPDDLPAYETLLNENIFVMKSSKAIHQDMRPLKILILNLMPTKINTEKQILRILSNNPIQMQIEFLRTKSHTSKNTSPEHLERFYKTFNQIKHKKYDGLIITGAPVENFDFEEVHYWEELKEIMEWSTKKITSTLYICWAVQAALNYFYGLSKYPLGEKISGVFKHTINNKKEPIVRGFDDDFYAPHSRYTEIKVEDIDGIDDLEIISESKEAGIYIMISKNKKNIFVTGHSEYDSLTLKDEYERDKKKGISINIPKNYFPDNDPSKTPKVKWRSHANLLFSNWINYYVYQRTAFE